ncbi:MAG: D-aminoacyl-tRNA deacylase [Turicibacter sp.]
MKVVVQRTKQASVCVDEAIVGQINQGLMLLVGITHEDTLTDVKYCAKKIANMRIFDDEEGKMNHSVVDVLGSILSVSQFTLYGDSKKGNRPSFIQAARPEVAKPLYDAFNEILRTEYGLTVETGIFGAMMDINFINWGPVTLIVET